MSYSTALISAAGLLRRSAAALGVLAAMSVTAAPVPIDLHLTMTSAMALSQCGRDVCFDTPLPLVPSALNVRLEIDASAPLLAWGPTTYRSGDNTATITSSFARYANPGIVTPKTAELLSLFSGLSGVSDFTFTDVSAGFFDNDSGVQGSIGVIRIFRQLGWSRAEGDDVRVISYYQSLEIPAIDYLASAADIAALDAQAIESMLTNSSAPLVDLREFASSYLERDCGAMGCLRTDATGAFFAWREVPRGVSEPASILLCGLALVALAGMRHARSVGRG